MKKWLVPKDFATARHILLLLFTSGFSESRLLVRCALRSRFSEWDSEFLTRCFRLWISLLFGSKHLKSIRECEPRRSSAVRVNHFDPESASAAPQEDHHR